MENDMENKDFRQKTDERDEFDYDQRKRIALKSDDCCCHCGRKTYFGYGATVDHFIPISKGGSNDVRNLIMLCKDCNEDKGDLIINPKGYIEYLKDPYYEELEDYFTEYVDSFEYIERNNVLACDEYKICIYPNACKKIIMNMSKKKNRHSYRDMDRYAIQHRLKRATFDDKDKLVSYFKDYLRRRSSLENEKTVYLNIDFWLKFGCIYYIENANGVRFMAAITYRETLTRDKNDYERKDRELLVFMFPGSSNNMNATLAESIKDFMSSQICEEQRLYEVPVTYSFLKTEPLAEKFMTLKGMPYYDGGDFWYSPLRVIGPDTYAVKEKDETGEEFLKRNKEESDEKLDHFFNKFRYLYQEVSDWGLNNPTASWMTNMLYEIIEDLEVQKVMDKLNDLDNFFDNSKE